MKINVILAMTCCLLFSQAALAQPEKGDFMIGGTAGFNSYKYRDYSSSYIYLLPQAGYFFTDNLAAGALLNLEFWGGDAEGSWIGIGPYARYYFNNSGPARFFGQAGIEFYNIDYGGNSDSFTNFGFDVAAGVDYFLNRHIALEAMLGFNSNKDQDDDKSETNFGLTIGVAAFIGGGSD